MTNIRLQNPNMDETIKVKEGYKLIRDMLEWLGRGNIDYLQLQQIELEERIITISPKNFAKIDYYEAEEVENEMMTRNEAVQKLATAGRLSIAHAEDLYDSFFPKPAVSQCVADWYEEIKDNFGYDLVEAINSIPVPVDGEEYTDFEKWVLDNENALTTLVNMHQFGYKVKKEPRYAVSIKGIKVDKSFLNYDKFSNTWSFEDDDTGVDRFRAIHTRKELEKAGFGEVFDNPMFEIEEVE